MKLQYHPVDHIIVQLLIMKSFTFQIYEFENESTEYYDNIW